MMGYQQNTMHALLGWWYGDGSKFALESHQLKYPWYFRLQLADIDVLNHIKTILKSDHYISIFCTNQTGKFSHRPQGGIAISDDCFALKLRELGCVPAIITVAFCERIF